MINFSLKTLKNGLRLVTAPISTSEAVTILILVGVGGRFEKDSERGISHFLEHLFFKGTKNRPTASHIARELDALGAEYNAFTSEEYTGYYVKSAANDFKKLLDILSDMFLEPTFPKEEVEREKGVILEEANMRRDVPQSYVQVLSQKQMFPDNPLGEDLVGREQTIKKISRDDIIRYREEGYSSRMTTVVICGKKTADWEKSIEARFAGLSAKAKPSFIEAKSNRIWPKISQDIRKVDQAHFILSCLGYKKTDSRRYALAILSTILGGGMSSRLFTQIRERRGWAYYVGASLGAFHDTGFIDFVAGVKQDKLADSVKIILDQIEDLKSKGPTSEELERTKSNLRGHLALTLEDSFEIANFLSEELLYENKIRQPERILAEVEKVSADQIKKLSQELFHPDRMGLAIVGPKDYTSALPLSFRA